MRGIDDIKEFEASTGSGDEAAKRHDDGLRPDEEEPDRRPRAGHGPGVQIAAPDGNRRGTPAGVGNAIEVSGLRKFVPIRSSLMRSTYRSLRDRSSRCS